MQDELLKHKSLTYRIVGEGNKMENEKNFHVFFNYSDNGLKRTYLGSYKRKKIAESAITRLKKRAIGFGLPLDEENYFSVEEGYIDLSKEQTVYSNELLNKRKNPQ